MIANPPSLGRIHRFPVGPATFGPAGPAGSAGLAAPTAGMPSRTTTATPASAAAPVIQRSPAALRTPARAAVPGAGTPSRSAGGAVQRLALGGRPAGTPLPVLPAASTASAVPRAAAQQAPVTVSAVNRTLPPPRASSAAVSRSAGTVQRAPDFSGAVKAVRSQVDKLKSSGLGGGVGFLMGLGGGSLLSGGRRNTYQDLRNKAEAAVPPTSSLRSDPRAWNDMMTLLDAVSRMKSAELDAAVIGVEALIAKTLADAIGESADQLLKTIHVDDVLYSNISRRLRADMRIDRERFGRLRDGVR